MEIRRSAGARRPATITALALAVASGLTLTACGSSEGAASNRAGAPWPEASSSADTVLHTGYLQVLDENDAPSPDVVSIYTPDGVKQRQATLPADSGIAIASYRDSVLYGGKGRVTLVDSATGDAKVIPVRGEVVSADPALVDTRRYTNRFVALAVEDGATDQLLDLQSGTVLDLAKAVDDPGSDRAAAVVAAYVSPDGRHVLLSNGTQTVLVATDAPDQVKHLADLAVPGGFTTSGPGVLTTRAGTTTKVALVDPGTGALTVSPEPAATAHRSSSPARSATGWSSPPVARSPSSARPARRWAARRRRWTPNTSGSLPTAATCCSGAATRARRTGHSSTPAPEPSPTWRPCRG